MVTTDDDEIEKELARSCNAITIKRPGEISGDTAESEDALLHAIKELEKLGPVEEKITFLQCTSPFTTAEDIDLCNLRIRSECTRIAALRLYHGTDFSGLQQAMASIMILQSQEKDAKTLKPSY